jgi:hypothetical protein
MIWWFGYLICMAVMVLVADQPLIDYIKYPLGIVIVLLSPLLFLLAGMYVSYNYLNKMLGKS